MTGTDTTALVEGMPRHVAIIMDGNGRWAAQRGKSRTHGHRAGASAVRKAVAFARRNHIDALTLFAFSSENWGRPEKEVNLLMELFVAVLKREVPQLKKNGVRLNVIGDISRFSQRLQERIQAAQAATAEGTDLVLNVAANYGGRWDIANACQSLARQVQAGTLEPSDIDESAVAGALSLADLPPPDLLIRTGGDIRISNFLLWQLAYAELYFADILWPDFNDHTFMEAIDCFMRRERRFGLTSEQRQQLLAGI